MKKLYSIQTSDKVFETGGSRPVLITCDDMNAYVCKYISSTNSGLKLAYEYIAASFLKLWGLKVPDFALVNISREHIPTDWNLRNPNFNITCFGSKYSRDYADLNNFVDAIDPNKRKSTPIVMTYFLFHYLIYGLQMKIVLTSITIYLLT